MDSSTTLGAVIDNPAARAVMEKYFPSAAISDAGEGHRQAPLGQLLAMAPGLAGTDLLESLWEELAPIDDAPGAKKTYARAINPNNDYEPADVARGTASVTLPAATRRWDVAEILLKGPSHGNPFVDVDFHADLTRPDGSALRVGGFYDGDGRFLVRILADTEGEWSLTVSSTARSLDGITGTFAVLPPAPNEHGPVRVDGMHFVHADGRRHRPLGTTAYAWTHQTTALQEQTLRTLANSPFTKMRMCVFPKSYLYNSNEPADFVFPGSLDTGFDYEHFNLDYFRNLETRVRELNEIGVQADLILFHPYDRWGFADLGPAVDERYVRYLVRRLAAFPNVWWSMANEFDLVWTKTFDDWERLAEVVVSEDPFDHLISIHNCTSFYDYTRPWITHVSNQRVDVYRTAENIDEWRTRWGKPVVVDECAYEGDIDYGWGNITGEEMVRRFWEGAVRGGYVGHGETYLPKQLGGVTDLGAVAGEDPEVMWWAKGGILHGTSPARVAFLERLIAEAPEGVWEPQQHEWDLPWGGASGHLVGYFGFSRPQFREITLGPGKWTIDVIDTWAMTIERVPGIHGGRVRVDLPGRQFMAVRAVKVETEH
jgi:hypothetical protein